MKQNIFILSAPVQSGKTTALATWTQQYSGKVNGFLTPDVHGLRVVQNLCNGEIFPFERITPEPGDIQIGRFTFAKSGFDTMRRILNENCTLSATPFIMDEIGKLELKNEGLEPALSRFLHFHKESGTPILLVVRDYLLTEVIQKYHLQNPVIIPFTKPLEWNPV